MIPWTTSWPNPYHIHPKRGNISLIMLFVLAIGSLIGLMSTWFVKDMISSAGSLREFYQSYYISQGGLELWVLAVERYDYGFEGKLTGTESLLRDNLNCKKSCNLWVTITSRIRPTWSSSTLFWSNPSPIISQICTSFTKDKITLSWWSSYIIPLFADQRTFSSQNNPFVNLLDTRDYGLNIMPVANYTWQIGIGIALWSWFKSDYEWLSMTGKQSLYITGIITGTLFTDFNINKFLYNSDSITWGILQTSESIGAVFWSSNNLLTKQNFNYLFITNISNENYSFCLKADSNTNWYVLDNAIVTSIASYGATTIGLEAVIKKPLPDYIINSYSIF
jgi:hypothetical protein